MQSGFIAFGHGYEKHSTQGRCTAFDGFRIIAAPLGEFSEADRERRVWQREGSSWGVTYGSHAIKLAVRDTDRPRGLYILGHHGGGREVLALNTGPDWEAMRDTLLALDERTLYAVLYSIWQTAADVRREAESRTAGKWAQAYADGHIRKRRATRNRPARVEILQSWELDSRKRA